ncbi:hypothetical protein WJX81_001967 [Elliptochloris bilobata]|uniref:Uncharacterized protein n=1 Tax=Elliptochloris bilobata TaxID=381761 RepID=A0AAW1S814_9CHLO
MNRCFGAPDAHYKSLTGKRVLITGGSSGIGKALALAFSANGAIVAITGRRKERLEAVCGQLKEGHYVIADLMKVSDCARTVAEAVFLMGGLDILVNSGGVETEAMMREPSSERAFADAFTMHVATVAALVDAAAPHLTASGAGAVVNVSSLSAIQVNPDATCYNVAQAAQDHLTKTLARKYTKHGLRVNSVNPCYVDTEFFDATSKESGLSKEQLHEWAKTENELHRVMTPDEVAGPILFLASDAASFISGVHLRIDGATGVHEEIQLPA